MNGPVSEYNHIRVGGIRFMGILKCNLTISQLDWCITDSLLKMSTSTEAVTGFLQCGMDRWNKNLWYIGKTAQPNILYASKASLADIQYVSVDYFRLPLKNFHTSSLGTIQEHC